MRNAGDTRWRVGWSAPGAAGAGAGGGVLAAQSAGHAGRQGGDLVRGPPRQARRRPAGGLDTRPHQAEAGRRRRGEPRAGGPQPGPGQRRDADWRHAARPRHAAAGQTAGTHHRHLGGFLLPVFVV